MPMMEAKLRSMPRNNPGLGAIRILVDKMNPEIRIREIVLRHNILE